MLIELRRESRMELAEGEILSVENPGVVGKEYNGRPSGDVLVGDTKAE